MKSWIKVIFVAFTSSLTALTIAGCVEPEAPEGTEPASQALSPDCSCWGSYTCPNQPTLDFDYDEPYCGPYTKPQQASRCNAACSVACVDSGWYCE